MLNKFKKNNNKGFTLVELLVVIAIIGILAVVAVPSLFKQIDKAKATQVVSNVKAINTEIMTEYANGNEDADVVDAVNDYIESDITDIKLSETYEVSAKNGEITITVTMEDKDTIAENIADQLGGTATGSVVTYTVKK